MLVPAKCSINTVQMLMDEIAVLDSPESQDYLDIKDEQMEICKQLVSKCIANGILDGSNLQKQTFPFDSNEYDVFISYSHNDEELAYLLYQYLTDSNLKCFLDSTIWYSADDLLKEIDNKYCRNGDSSYSYQKRNFSTAHVHTMLGMSMLEAVNRSELILFLESDKSLPLRTGINKQTLSPWIYQEMQFANHIQPRIPSRMHKIQTRLFSKTRKEFLAENRVQDSRLQVAYHVDFSNFQNLDLDDLRLLQQGQQGLDNVYKQHKLKHYEHSR